MSTTFIKIIKGSYRNQALDGMIFPLVKDFKQTASSKFVTVNGADVIDGANNIRVKVESREAFVVVAEEAFVAQQEAVQATAEPVAEETDEDIMARISERFDVLDLMTGAVIRGDVRGLVVTGPPGVGKSYGVETQLEETGGLFSQIKGEKIRYHIVKGQSTALGLYSVLYKYSDKGDVIVFDDCDDLFGCEVSLNLLKGALDSGKKRRLAWNSSSSTFLEKEGIPEAFQFNGTVIFISNLKLEAAKGKMAAHMEALMSRCHYLDLTMDTMREKLLRIEQVAKQGNLFKDYDFSEGDEAEVMVYMKQNQDNFREMSLRTALKISDLKKISPNNWKALARSTCMKRDAKFVG